MTNASQNHNSIDSPADQLTTATPLKRVREAIKQLEIAADDPRSSEAAEPELNTIATQARIVCDELLTEAGEEA